MLSPETVPTTWCDPAARRTPEWQLHGLFRLALCAEFVGHGGSAALPTESKEVLAMFELRAAGCLLYSARQGRRGVSRAYHLHRRT